MFVGALLYPHHEEKAGRGTISSGEITDDLPASCAQLILDKGEFYEGERIKFTLKNGCSYPVTLRNSAPWKIRDEFGEEVYSPIALQVIGEVDQRDDRGNQVKPGTYLIALETMNAGTLMKSFKIRAGEP